MGRFDRDDYIFKNRDVLNPEYEPDELEERDDELDEYATVLRPVIKGWNPNNIFVYGDTGNGKTLTTHVILDELYEASEQYDDVNLNIIELNCTNTRSSYQVAIHLVNEIRKPEREKEPLTTVLSDRETLSETGYQAKRVYNELFRDLNDIGGTILIVLDEIDNIGNDDALLYELPRAQTHHNVEAKLGVIGISNDYQFRRNLSAKVRDTLCEEELFFSPYTADELGRILHQRIEHALFDGTVGTGVISLCSAFAANDTGSARQAIQLLRRAAQMAENDALGDAQNTPQITETHVRQADTDLQKEQVVKGMHDLTSHARYLLLAVTHLEAEGETPVRTKHIVARYRSVAKDFGSEPLKRRGAHDHLSKLNMKSIIRLVDTGGRGNFNAYELDVSLVSAIDALESEFGELNSLREKARRYINQSTI